MDTNKFVRQSFLRAFTQQYGNYENSVRLEKCLHPMQVLEILKMYVLGKPRLTGFRSYNWHELLQITNWKEIYATV